MKISIEELIILITREVISELSKIGIAVDFNISANFSSEKSIESSIELDMSNYKTPVITESSLISLDSDISEIIVPTGTVITPGARDIIRKKNLNVIYKNKSN